MLKSQDYILYVSMSGIIVLIVKGRVFKSTEHQPMLTVKVLAIVVNC